MNAANIWNMDVTLVVAKHQPARTLTTTDTDGHGWTRMDVYVNPCPSGSVTRDVRTNMHADCHTEKARIHAHTHAETCTWRRRCMQRECEHTCPPAPLWLHTHSTLTCRTPCGPRRAYVYPRLDARMQAQIHAEIHARIRGVIHGRRHICMITSHLNREVSIW